jgi:hypothetical protein
MIFLVRYSSDLRKVLLAISLMERKNVSEATHPTNLERLIALRQGLLAANCEYYKFVLGSQIQADTSLMRQLYSRQSTAIGLRSSNGEVINPFVWAHNEALMIVNTNSSLARNLIRYDDLTDWNRSLATPIVTFSFKVQNRNKVAVRFAGRTVLEIIPRLNENDVVNIAPVDGLSFDATLQPGQTKEFKGTLTWVADDKMMPHLVFPGDARSPYFVFDVANPVPEQRYLGSYNFDYREWQEDSPEEVFDLVDFLCKNRTRLAEISKGIGVSNLSDPAKINMVKYQSLFDFEFKFEHEISARLKHNELLFQIKVFEIKDYQEALRRFDSILAKCELRLGKYRPFVIFTSKFKSTIFYDGDERIFEVQILESSKEPKLTSFSVEFSRKFNN